MIGRESGGDGIRRDVRHDSISGLIPTYLLISNLGMLDTIWAILLPGAFSVWNMIIARTYYMGIPRDSDPIQSSVPPDVS